VKTSSQQTPAKPSSTRKKAASTKGSVRTSGKRVRRQRTMRARGRA
jgi:hypothetical protein